MSPYARSLIELMRTAPTELERAKAEVLLACYWARVGDRQAADEIRQRSRSKYPSGMYAELTIMHMCLDGLMHYYSDQSPAAADRLKSAHALASTYRFRKEQGFSAAWLAHVEFNRDHWEAMFDALRSCRAALDGTDKATQGRLSLIVADVLLYLGEASISKLWYDSARLLFTSIGDHAAIEAFLYNGAALRLHSARLRSITEAIPADELPKLGGDIASATNYQRITQQRSLDYLLAAATASHKILLADYPSAREILNGLLAEGDIPKASKAPPLLLADKALCEALLEGPERGLAAIRNAENAVTDELSADDIALAAHTLSRACLAVGLEAEALEWGLRRDKALESFNHLRARLKSQLQPWMTEPSSVLPAVN